MAQMEVRPIRTHSITRVVPADEQEMSDYVARHGLQAAFRHLFHIAEKLGQGYPAIVSGQNVTVLIHNIGERCLQIPTLPAGSTTWETRRAVDAMMQANPKLSRHTARALYNSQPRSQAKKLVGPRSAASPGQRKWDSRLQNIIDRAAAKGRHITWDEAHNRAVDEMQEAKRRQRQRQRQAA